MTARVSVTYELVGTGWSSCVIQVGEQRVILSASYLSDALGNLILFALTMASGFRSASFSFDEEPGEFRWTAEALDGNRIRVQVLEFKELWGYQPNSQGTLLIEAVLTPLELAEAIASAATEVLERYGQQGYGEKWAEHNFPERELAMLKFAIEEWRK